VAFVLALALAAAGGCSSDGIDPPADGEYAGEDAPVVDSLVAWARSARELWASGDSTRAGDAAERARAVFSGVWADLAADADSDARVRDAEHLPSQRDAASPGAEAVSEKLAGLGLSADIAVADGPIALWQVVLRDPTGAADAATEFWAWPDPATPLGEPVLQPLPANAPARARYGPEAVGALVTYPRSDGAGLASAWTRPRGAGGIEVALLQRKDASGRAAKTWRVVSTRLLQVAADSVAFAPVTGGDRTPSLLVRGAGGRNALFDECPTCPRLDRRQRYQFEGATWTLREERSEPSPYAAIVAFMQALRDGGPESALPWAAGPEVLDQVRELGLERGPIVPLRAAPGTTAGDRTQRFRRGGGGGSDGLEITLDQQGERWVVADLRPTRLVIE
jgi:hypothetical protein